VKVILNQEVRGVGSPGDVVEVAGGYGRNYLLPRNLARPATKGAIREAENIRARRQAREMATLEQAQTMASHLASVRVTIPAKAGPEGRLFGSITAQQVAEAIQNAARTNIDRRRSISTRRSSRPVSTGSPSGCTPRSRRTSTWRSSPPDAVAPAPLPRPGASCPGALPRARDPVDRRSARGPS
jgi:large subunit ribosomal protein L9